MIKEMIIAAGCFWGVQSAFDEVPGVVATEVGYIGGKVENPTYEVVCKGNTGHAEAVRIQYDTDKTSYDKLLDVFFKIHNPTTLNRQGPDVGEQYRSAVFYLDENQKQAALKKIETLNHLGKFRRPIVTKIIPAGTFYPAEAYHQKYFEKQGLPSCHIRCSDEDWKDTLSPEAYHVLREKGTEHPGSGKYLHFNEQGIYECAACGNKIFDSDAKFESLCGWPSFDKAIPGSVKIQKDFSHFMIRDEVLCARCGSHLGHVFKDGPTETQDRFCINSVALDFEKTDADKKGD